MQHVLDPSNFGWVIWLSGVAILGAACARSPVAREFLFGPPDILRSVYAVQLKGHEHRVSIGPGAMASLRLRAGQPMTADAAERISAALAQRRSLIPGSSRDIMLDRADLVPEREVSERVG
jgi:hypothetical protein